MFKLFLFFIICINGKNFRRLYPELNNIDIVFDNNENNVNIDSLNNIESFDISKKEVNLKKEINPLEVKKKFIIDTVKKFCKVELIEIFKIIKKYNIKYTENSNGIFINLNIVNENILDEIKLFIDFCITKKNSLQVERNKRENLAKLIKEDTEKIFKINKEINSNIIEQEVNLNIQKGIEYSNSNNNNNNDEDKNEMYYKESNFILPTVSM